MKSIYIDLKTIEKDLETDKAKEHETKLLTSEDIKDENGEFAEINEFFK